MCLKSIRQIASISSHSSARHNQSHQVRTPYRNQDLQMENLKNRKPSHLRHAAPWLFSICLAYMVSDLMIGIGFYNTSPRVSPYVIVHGIFDNHFWGLVFITVGVLWVVALLIDRRKFTRFVIVAGLIVKSFWFYALLVKASWTTLAAIGVWGLIFVVQLVTLIYYPER